MTGSPPPPLPDILTALRTARLEQVTAAEMWEFTVASNLLGYHVDQLLNHHDRNTDPKD